MILDEADLDADGAPVAGAEVHLFGLTCFGRSTTQNTDANGELSLTPLMASYLRLSAHVPPAPSGECNQRLARRSFLSSLSPWNLRKL